MFLRKLLKKFSEIFNIKFFESILINNFRELIIIIFSFGLISIILIIILASGSKQKIYSENIITKQDDKKTDIIDREYITSEILLNSDDFMIIDIKDTDLSFDYVEFLPKKYYKLPDINIIKKSYDEIFYKSIEEDLKFNFEKRKN